MRQQFNPLYEEPFGCPFCRMPISLDAKELTYDGFTTFEGGQCDCGAVYVFDFTGSHQGEDYENALLYACKGNWDYAMSLEPDVDYETKVLAPHRSLPKRSLARMGFSGQKKGKFFFLKLQKRVE
ncbi:MAG TPA: hypothetical protein VJL89_05705 [Thermodesulfovibrionia bacterium]|nr:hypothetical protein [Thermodesulfovibrionia bacterium]